MFIKISKILDEYYFEIGDSNDIDAPESFLSSIKDHCLIPSIPEKFSTFVEAHHYASEIVDNNPTIVSAKKLFFYKKGESMEESGIDENPTAVNDKILEFYGDQLSLFEERLKEINENIEDDEYKPEEESKIFQSFKDEIEKATSGIQKIVDENDFSDDEREYLENVYSGLKKIVKIVDKFLPPEELQLPSPAIPAGAPASPEMLAGMPPAAPSPSPMPEGMPVAASNKDKIVKNASSILKAFGESAVLAINKLHPLSYIKSIYKDNETDDYSIIIAEGKENIIGLKFSNRFLLNEIIPLQKEHYRKAYASEFLDKYWIPITYSIGHFDMGDSVIVPNYNMSHKKIYGFNKNGKTIIAKINIENEDKGLGIKKSWSIKLAQENKKRVSDFKQEELIKAEVVCIDKKLPTYYQRSGKVLSVIPRDDYIDLVIDFRRGLDKLVLRDDQVDIVNLPN